MSYSTGSLLLFTVVCQSCKSVASQIGTLIINYVFLDATCHKPCSKWSFPLAFERPAPLCRVGHERGLAGTEASAHEWCPPGGMSTRLHHDSMRTRNQLRTVTHTCLQTERKSTFETKRHIPPKYVNITSTHKIVTGFFRLRETHWITHFGISYPAPWSSHWFCPSDLLCWTVGRACLGIDPASRTGPIPSDCPGSRAL